MAIVEPLSENTDLDAPDDEEQTYHRLMSLLSDGSARYRLIDHPPEGGTVAASRLRGHPADQAAKCMVVRLSVTRRSSRYLLGVVPGDRRVCLRTLQQRYGARAASLASAETAERLSGAVSGAVLPFSFHPDLDLVVDPGLLVHPHIYFNAARLDRSLALRTDDYVRLSRPRIQPIATPE
ncbi:YbaK/EbsC family protein [Micromonospora sp. DT201]|uniref:YbaK/EbsC family protein n=1 Tax=Micromonospora sp. DT201 TaxID=3393442 RepID=UPI003CF92888